MKEAEDVLSKHGNQTDNIQSRNIKDITKLLCTYRVKEDKPIPTKKKDVVDLYHNWKRTRPLTKYNGKVVVDITDEDNVTVTVTNEPELPVLPLNQAATQDDRKVPIPLEAVVETEASVVQPLPNSMIGESPVPV